MAFTLDPNLGPYYDVSLVLGCCVFCKDCGRESLFASSHPEFSTEYHFDQAATMQREGWQLLPTNFEVVCPACAAKRQDAAPPPVLDYAGRPSRFHVAWHLPTAIVASIIVLLLNVWPHFVTSVTPGMSDFPEPELGWPWVFFLYGYSFSGYGAVVVWEYVGYDLFVSLLVVVGASHWGGRMRRRGATSEV